MQNKRLCGWRIVLSSSNMLNRLFISISKTEGFMPNIRITHIAVFWTCKRNCVKGKFVGCELSGSLEISLLTFWLTWLHDKISCSKQQKSHDIKAFYWQLEEVTNEQPRAIMHLICLDWPLTRDCSSWVGRIWYHYLMHREMTLMVY